MSHGQRRNLQKFKSFSIQKVAHPSGINLQLAAETATDRHRQILPFPPYMVSQSSLFCPCNKSLKPGTHHAIFVVCWTQRRRKDDCCMVCAHQRQLSPVDFTNATVVGPIRKTNRSNNFCMVCAGQRHLSHQPTGHRPITVKHFRDA